jgi:hypothetical protein
MAEYPFIYICSHAGKIGNIRWVNSDTRWPDEYKPVPGGGFQLGYWGRCGLRRSMPRRGRPGEPAAALNS